MHTIMGPLPMQKVIRMLTFGCYYIIALQNKVTN